MYRDDNRQHLGRRAQAAEIGEDGSLCSGDPVADAVVLGVVSSLFFGNK